MKCGIELLWKREEKNPYSKLTLNLCRLMVEKKHNYKTNSSEIL